MAASVSREERRPAATASVARAAIDVPDAYASRQPVRPHAHSRPGLRTVMWPNSPPSPVAPRCSRPPTSKPPPTPVERVRYSMVSDSRPCPKRYSPSAAADASFSSRASTPNSERAMSTIGMSRQPGRCSGRTSTPRDESSGPPQPIPTAMMGSNSPVAASIDRRQSCHSRSRMTVGPSSGRVGSSTRPCTFPSGVTTPTASLVPPMSMPSTGRWSERAISLLLPVAKLIHLGSRASAWSTSAPGCQSFNQIS